MVHDKKNEAKVGDKVVVKETRPLSARKRHILDKITDRPVIREQQSVEAVTVEPVVEKPVKQAPNKKETTKKNTKKKEEKE